METKRASTCFVLNNIIFLFKKNTPSLM